MQTDKEKHFYSHCHVSSFFLRFLDKDERCQAVVVGPNEAIEFPIIILHPVLETLVGGDITDGEQLGVLKNMCQHLDRQRCFSYLDKILKSNFDSIDFIRLLDELRGKLR